MTLTFRRRRFLRMMHRIGSLALFATFVFVTACSGTQSTVPSQRAKGSDGLENATATLRIVIPNRASSAASRRPQYVSVSTESIAVAFTPSAGGATQNFDESLTSSNPDCTGSPLVCTLSFILAPGSYNASFTTYSGTLNVSGTPTGSVLSANQSVSVTLVAGTANTIPVVLDGVPSSAIITPSFGGVENLATGGTAAYTISTCSTPSNAFTTTLSADDAVGNSIIGSGAPTAAISSANATATVSHAGNTFTIVPVSPDVTLSATLTPASASGGASVDVTVGLQLATQNCGIATTFAGGGTGSFTNGTGTAASFNAPYRVAADSSGTLYVADTGNNVIRRITQDGVVSTFAGSGTAGFVDGPGSVAEFKGPHGVAVGLNGYVYVSDTGNDAIRVITPEGVVTTLAGSGSSGFVNGTGTAARFSGPDGLAVDSAGNVYVADNSNDAIRKITPAGVVMTLATGGGPRGVAVDAIGNVYAAGNGNEIDKITPAGNVSLLAGNSSAGSADGLGSAARFDQPASLAIDGSGTLYVADTNNNLIRVVSPLGQVTTLAGSGSGYADGTGTAVRFHAPQGVAIDFSGNLYVADSDNQRIRKIQFL